MSSTRSVRSSSERRPSSPRQTTIARSRVAVGADARPFGRELEHARGRAVLHALPRDRVERGTLSRSAGRRRGLDVEDLQRDALLDRADQQQVAREPVQRGALLADRRLRAPQRLERVEVARDRVGGERARRRIRDARRARRGARRSARTPTGRCGASARTCAACCARSARPPGPGRPAAPAVAASVAASSAPVMAGSARGTSSPSRPRRCSPPRAPRAPRAPSAPWPWLAMLLRGPAAARDELVDVAGEDLAQRRAS